MGIQHGRFGEVNAGMAHGKLLTLKQDEASI